jgi:hypothetical protein
MIQTYAHQKELQEARLDIKSCEQLFANLITAGTNCSPFESDIIVEKAKEIFAIGEHREGNILQPGQMIWIALDIEEPAGKPLRECKQKRIVLTHTAKKEDSEVRRQYGRSAKRQQQIVRMSEEARQQGALLTQEDLAELLDTDVRTIRRDMAELRNRALSVPTRGQQKDIGPGLSHRIRTIELFLQGKEPVEIARQLKHSLSAVERYIDAFCRVVYCQRQFRSTLKTALVVGASVSTVNHYMDFHAQACEDPAYRARISQIEQRGRIFWEAMDFKKNPGLIERRPK